jgi:hypothetical protein
MTDGSDSTPEISASAPLLSQTGKPILITDLNMAGVSAQAARGSETVEIITRMSLTSDEALFHQMVANIAAAIEHAAIPAGSYCKLDQAHTVLLALRPDNSGELWIDAATVNVCTALKRPGPMEAGTVLFENDIADVTGIWFPFIEVGPQDRVLCLFREGWRFGLFFDFNPDSDLDIDGAKRALGTLYRRMRFADLYAALAHEPTFSELIKAGWFPFLELMSGEFKTLVSSQQAGFGLEDPERDLLAKFDEARLDRMFERWMEKPHLRAKGAILQPAIRAFKAGDAVSAIKNVLTEIEGVMAEAYFQVNQERTRQIKKLLDFTISIAEQRAGGKDTLFFPVEFGQYLKNFTYADYHPGDIGTAGSRHAVGHGAVAAESYTMTRALQAILTMDQLAFYI